jgi:hypothetical protein
MKRISRRKFAVVVGGAAVAATAAPSVLEAASRPLRSGGRGPKAGRTIQQPAQEPAAARDVKPKYGMSKEQEEQVRQAVERGARGRAALRNYKFKYADEPAFVFRAKLGKKD